MPAPARRDRAGRLDGALGRPAPGHVPVTRARTLDELRAMVREALRCHFDEDERPKLIRLHFVRDEVIAARTRVRRDGRRTMPSADERRRLSTRGDSCARRCAVMSTRRSGLCRSGCIASATR